MRLIPAAYLAFMSVGIVISLIGMFFYSELTKQYETPKHPQFPLNIISGSENETVFLEVTLVVYTAQLQRPESEWKTVDMLIRINEPAPPYVLIRIPWRIAPGFVYSGKFVNETYVEYYESTYVYIEPDDQTHNIHWYFGWNVMTRKSYDAYEMNIDLIPSFSSHTTVERYTLEVIPPLSSILDARQAFPFPSRTARSSLSTGGSSMLAYVWEFFGEDSVKANQDQVLHLPFVFENKAHEKENWIFLSGVVMGAGVSMAISGISELAKWIIENTQVLKSIRRFFKRSRTSKVE